jgi:hypothetical protein
MTNDILELLSYVKNCRLAEIHLILCLGTHNGGKNQASLFHCLD